MTTPEQPEIPGHLLDDEPKRVADPIRYLQVLAKIAWPSGHDELLLEALGRHGWRPAVEIAAGEWISGMRVVRPRLGEDEPGNDPLLLIVHPDCLRVFELNLKILSGAANVPELSNVGLSMPPPGALTKVVERSAMRELEEVRERLSEIERLLMKTRRVDNLLEAASGRIDRQEERMARLEHKALPADVRVLSDRIDGLKERLDELAERCADFVDEEDLERETNQVRDNLVEHKREVTRRFDRLERDIERLEGPRRDHRRTR